MRTASARTMPPGGRRPAAAPRGLPVHLLAAIGGFAALLVLVVLGPYMTYRPGSNGEGSPVRQVLYFATALLVVGGARPWRDPMRLLSVAWPVGVVLAWCWLSLAWSDVPGLAVRRLVLTTLIVWTLFVGVRELGYARSLAIFRGVAIFALVGNFLVVALLPEYGIHHAVEDGDSSVVGAWCGMMISKNFAGLMCALTVLAFFFDPRNMPAWLRWGVIAGAAVFLWGSESKTSAGIGAFAIACGLLFQRYNPAYRALILPAVLVAIGAVALAVVLYWDRVQAVLYDPEAFTGRATIWAALVAYHRDHWLGTGYGSFWNIGVGVGPIFEYGRGWITTITSGHNGYLDLLAQIGMPGLVLVVAGLILWPIGRLLASRRVGRAEGALLLSIVIFTAGHNLTESTLLDRDALGQVFLTLAIAMIAHVTRPRRLDMQPQPVRG